MTGSVGVAFAFAMFQSVQKHQEKCVMGAVTVAKRVNDLLKLSLMDGWIEMDGRSKPFPQIVRSFRRPFG